MQFRAAICLHMFVLLRWLHFCKNLMKREMNMYKKWRARGREKYSKRRVAGRRKFVSVLKWFVRRCHCSLLQSEYNVQWMQCLYIPFSQSFLPFFFISSKAILFTEKSCSNKQTKRKQKNPQLHIKRNSKRGNFLKKINERTNRLEKNEFSSDQIVLCSMYVFACNVMKQQRQDVSVSISQNKQ